MKVKDLRLSLAGKVHLFVLSDEGVKDEQYCNWEYEVDYNRFGWYEINFIYADDDGYLNLELLDAESEV